MKAATKPQPRHPNQINKVTFCYFFEMGVSVKL